MVLVKGGTVSLTGYLAHVWEIYLELNQYSLHDGEESNLTLLVILSQDVVVVKPSCFIILVIATLQRALSIVYHAILVPSKPLFSYC